MKDWIQHEKGRQRIPATVHGTGYSITNQTEDNTGFERDDKTGLLLPENAAKNRRKVAIGFQPSTPTE